VSNDLEAFCLAHRLPWIQVRSSATFEGVLQRCLEAGLLALHA
jgi:hypothetical protein